MIILNNKKFARTEKDFKNSLFEKDGTCVGYYKPNKKSITLFDHQKNKVGVINRYGVLCSAQLDNGKYLYGYADIGIIGHYESFSAQQEEIYNVLNKYNIKIELS
jgi:hypothetical protein